MWMWIADMNCVFKLEEIWWPIVCDCIFLQFINSQVASMCFTIFDSQWTLCSDFSLDTIIFFYYFEKCGATSFKDSIFEEVCCNWICVRNCILQCKKTTEEKPSYNQGVPYYKIPNITKWKWTSTKYLELTKWFSKSTKYDILRFR